MTLKEPLTGERIVIRSCTPSDLDFCTGMWFDPENGRWLSDPDRAHVDDVYQRALDGMWNNGDGYYLVAEEKGTGERIGTCCAFPDAAGVYDIGYCVHKSRWRQGYGTELVGLLLSWIRERGGTAVTAEVAKENPGSRALLEKFGFRAARESSFRKYHMGITFDSVIYRKELR